LMADLLRLPIAPPLMSLVARASLRVASRGMRVPVFRRHMSAIKYTSDHEYVKTEGGVATVGITQFATEQLGDVVYVELPEVGKTLDQKDAMGVVESVKAASDVYAPVSGEVVEVNEALSDNPGMINESPMDKGWMAKIKMSSEAELDGMMDEAAYTKFCEESH